MKLQTKIFSYISVLFLVSLFIGVGITFVSLKMDITKIGEFFENNIKRIRVRALKRTQIYIENGLSYDLSQLKTIQNKIREYPFLFERFAPTVYNHKNNTWGDSCGFLLDEGYLDYILCVNEGKETSQLLIKEPYLNYIEICEEVEGLKLFRQKEEIYIGIPYWNVDMGIEKQNASIHSKHAYYLLFTVEQLLKEKEEDLILLNKRLPFAPMVIIDVMKDSKTYEKLCTTIKNRIIKTKEIIISTKIDWTNLTWDKGREEGYTQTNFERSYDQRLLLAQLGLIIASGYWDFDPFKETSPIGFVQLGASMEQRIVSAIFARDIFIQKPLIHSSTNPTNFIENQGEIFLTFEQVLIDKEKEKRKGRVVLGINQTPLFSSLAKILNQGIVIVKDQKVIAVYEEENVLHNISFDNLLLQLKKETRGVFNDQEEKRYYFQSIESELVGGVTFVLIDEKLWLYSLYQKVEETMHHFVQLIAMQMSFIRLFLFSIFLIILYKIIKKVTKPIRRLENAATLVAQGNLSAIELKALRKEKDLSDEIKDLCDSFSFMVEEMKKKEEIDAILHKVVSGKIADKIMEGDITLGGESKEVTVLFADIRNFTAHCEQKSAEEVVAMLNECFTHLTHVIDQHEGVVDKYVGDEVMALFGAPLDMKNSSEEAVLCGLEMIECIRIWNDKREKAGKERVEIGIGINTGWVIVGNIGEENRMNYTVIGKQVNRASRICSIAKQEELLVSEEVFDKLEREYESTPIENVELKGIKKGVTLHVIRKVKSKG